MYIFPGGSANAKRILLELARNMTRLTRAANREQAEVRTASIQGFWRAIGGEHSGQN